MIHDSILLFSITTSIAERSVTGFALGVVVMASLFEGGESFWQWNRQQMPQIEALGKPVKVGNASFEVKLKFEHATPEVDSVQVNLQLRGVRNLACKQGTQFGLNRSPNR